MGEHNNACNNVNNYNDNNHYYYKKWIVFQEKLYKTKQKKQPRSKLKSSHKVVAAVWNRNQMLHFSVCWDPHTVSGTPCQRKCWLSGVEIQSYSQKITLCQGMMKIHLSILFAKMRTYCTAFMAEKFWQFNIFKSSLRINF